MTSAFENLSGPNKPLRTEPPDKREFEGLIRSVHARLRDALNESLSIESRFDLATTLHMRFVLLRYATLAWLSLQQPICRLSVITAYA